MRPARAAAEAREAAGEAVRVARGAQPVGLLARLRLGIGLGLGVGLGLGLG